MLAKRPNPLARRAFSLMEMLVVMSVIVIVLAMGMPAFKFMTGSHSIGGAVNVTKAMLSRARIQAMANSQYTGLAIFFDATSQRYCEALVADPNQPTAGYYSGNLDFAANTDFQYLPPGIGAMAITNNVISNAGNTSVTRNNDGYLRLGVIMFDSRGRLVSVPFYANATTTFAAKANGGTAIPAVVTPPLPAITSQVGLALFDLETFNNQSFTTKSAYLDPPTINYNDGSGTCGYQRDIWLDANANGYLVDRYSGSILETPNP